MHRIAHSFTVAMMFMGLFRADTLLAAVESASWGQIKASVASHGPQPAGKMVTSRAVAGTKEVNLSLEVSSTDSTVAVTVVTGHLDGRKLGGLDVWVSYDDEALVPLQFDEGEVIKGTGFGLGFLIAHNPSNGTWKVSAASAVGTGHGDGELFTLVFSRNTKAHPSRLGIGIEFALLFSETAAKYTVAVNNRFYVAEWSMDISAGAQSDTLTIGQVAGAHDDYDQFDVAPPNPFPFRGTVLVHDQTRYMRDMRSADEERLEFIVEIAFGDHGRMNLYWDGTQLPSDARAWFAVPGSSWSGNISTTNGSPAVSIGHGISYITIVVERNAR